MAYFVEVALRTNILKTRSKKEKKMKKQLKFKIYQHECVDCGWKIWRDYPIVDSPRCSQCESTNPPKITEDELIREMIINDTYSPEDYDRAKRIAQEIIDGKPLEEIDGLNVASDMLASLEEGDTWALADISRVPYNDIRGCATGLYGWSLLGLLVGSQVVGHTGKNNYY
jgi:hypothetical protein